MTNRRDRSGVIAPPPLLTVLCIAAGLVIDHFTPLRFLPDDFRLRVIASGLVFIVAAAIQVAAISNFMRHQMHPSPYKPTTGIMVDGIYRFSRNPIYIAFLLIAAGVAIAANSAWVLLFTVVLFFLLRYGVIAREERYLQSKFGSTYDDYHRRVRRWI